MEIKIGRFTLRSDGFCYWIEEEYEIQKGKTKGKKGVKRVAGYASTLEILFRQFVEHKHRAIEANTVTELVKEMKQIAEDTELLKKAAVKEDLKRIRRIGKKIKEINE